jgi:transcription elongation factor Elf1
MERNHKESFVLDLKFKCNFCGECFGYRKDLTNHKRQYHSNVKFDCSVCGHSLASARGLRKHAERMHGNDSKVTHNKSVVSSSPVRQASVKDRDI